MEPIVINGEKADEVLRYASSNDAVTRRQALHSLRDLQQAVKARQKRIRIFNLTVQALDQQYARWQYSARQQLTHLDTMVADLNHQVAKLRQQRSENEEQLKVFERQLQGIREYAQRRRTKKTKREKQYNHFYFIPVVSKSFQQKYVRAQDKNAAAEQEVVQIRESIEAIQAAVRQAGNLLGRKQQEHDAQMEQRRAVHVQVAAADKCLAYLHEGQHFWNHFDQNQAEVVIEACSQLMQTFRSTSEPQLFRRRSSTSTDPQQRDWRVVFKSACIEYGEREAYGATKWDNVEVEFDCARCQQSLVGWPTPDKVHTADLLCAVCYQDMRTSMIMEKKMNVIGGKLGIERPEGPRRYSSSSKSTSRFSTSSVGSSSPSTTPPSSNRSSSFVGDAKKVFKGLSFLSKNNTTSKSTPSTPPLSSTVMPSKPHEYDQQPPQQQRRPPPSERPLPPQPPNAFPSNHRPVIA
ncbi:hypothetical protein O0I10_013008 [Lichtheimia ornata]|uniref:Uncharacterized protein n=1 Tax=Lichtheimia ornata TaxID=688661 RepID=A0AAD7XSK6_9FUNG|nr:uncharacterized protein O0I10_013008 [Lichtheimia ornata]KAJ8651443.1 hypothetical protein O0I10_013008 [Lichtheimia ornata]